MHVMDFILNTTTSNNSVLILDHFQKYVLFEGGCLKFKGVIIIVHFVLMALFYLGLLAKATQYITQRRFATKLSKVWKESYIDKLSF